MADQKNTTNTSKTQRDFLAWYAAEKQNGLKDIKFFPADVSQATVDSFIEESNSIDRAIASKSHSPLPANL